MRKYKLLIIWLLGSYTLNAQNNLPLDVVSINDNVDSINFEVSGKDSHGVKVINDSKRFVNIDPLTFYNKFTKI